MLAALVSYYVYCSLSVQNVAARLVPGARR